METKYTPRTAPPCVRPGTVINTDYDGDGWPDLAIVNEDTADVRVFLNLADGSGLFQDFLLPPTSVGNRASPNGPADFNGDGMADLTVANIDSSTISVLLGNDDGTFAPQTEIPVGPAPRGIAVLDADGDGHEDVALANSQDDNGAILIGDGLGGLAAPVTYPTDRFPLATDPAGYRSR